MQFSQDGRGETVRHPDPLIRDRRCELRSTMENTALQTVPTLSAAPPHLLWKRLPLPEILCDIYFDRIAGSDCDHCNSCLIVAAGSESG